MPVPGLVGRAVRIVVGSLLLLLLGTILVNYQLGQAVPLNNKLWWLGVACAIYFLPSVSYVPFGREPNNQVQTIVAILAIVAGFVDLSQAGRFLGSTLALLLMALMTYTNGVGGLSYVLAGLWAVPG